MAILSYMRVDRGERINMLKLKIKFDSKENATVEMIEITSAPERIILIDVKYFPNRNLWEELPKILHEHASNCDCDFIWEDRYNAFEFSAVLNALQSIPYIDFESVALETFLESQGYKYLKQSTSAGYVSRTKAPRIAPYNGRFGHGYEMHCPNWDSTRYHYIRYYIRKL